MAEGGQSRITAAADGPCPGRRGLGRLPCDGGTTGACVQAGKSRRRQGKGVPFVFLGGPSGRPTSGGPPRRSRSSSFTNSPRRRGLASGGLPPPGIYAQKTEKAWKPGLTPDGRAPASLHQSGQSVAAVVKHGAGGTGTLDVPFSKMYRYRRQLQS